MKKTAKDNAKAQNDKNLATRIPENNGTKINFIFDDVVIPGILNNSKTAQALIEKLPMNQQMSRYEHDFCGITSSLPYDKDEVHYGWLNGDIDYATDGPYLTILFEDEEDSEIYGNQVNIGVIDCPIKRIADLNGSYNVRIELAE